MKRQLIDPAYFSKTSFPKDSKEVEVRGPNNVFLLLIAIF